MIKLLKEQVFTRKFELKANCWNFRYRRIFTKISKFCKNFQLRYENLFTSFKKEITPLLSKNYWCRYCRKLRFTIKLPSHYWKCFIKDHEKYCKEQSATLSRLAKRCYFAFGNKRKVEIFGKGSIAKIESPRYTDRNTFPLSYLRAHIVRANSRRIYYTRVYALLDGGEYFHHWGILRDVVCRRHFRSY